MSMLKCMTQTQLIVAV